MKQMVGNHSFDGNKRFSSNVPTPIQTPVNGFSEDDEDFNKVKYK